MRLFQPQCSGSQTARIYLTSEKILKKNCAYPYPYTGYAKFRVFVYLVSVFFGTLVVVVVVVVDVVVVVFVIGTVSVVVVPHGWSQLINSVSAVLSELELE